MHNLAEIIRQIQQDLSCPVCGKKYEIGDIRIRGLFDHTLIIQTICANSHTTILMTAIKEIEKKTPINANDIIDIHLFLKSFNGDFKTLWNK